MHVDSKAPAETRITFTPLDNQANARRAHLPAQITLMGGNVIEIPIPEAAPEVTVMKFSMAGLPRFAGSFADLLSCAEKDGAVGFGYTFGSQKDAEYVVSPLPEARSRALGEDAK